jgi:Na+-transporting NADH:ubiquinone oxidoreductase subunit F
MELLVAIIVTCLVSAVLATLVIWADAVLLNYGECTITVNDEKKLTVQGGGNLLAALMDKKIFIPSACGGRGTCGLCKLKVLEGAGELLPTEEPYLSPEEVKQNTRLSCQVKVRNDLSVRIPEELLSVKEYVATVEKITDLNQDTKEIRLRLPEGEEMHFKAGQYIHFTAPPYGENPEPVYRAYSISSPPSEKNFVETIVRLVPGGICTTFMFEVMKEGDEININGPYGGFYLRDTDAEIVFIAGGSGIAPIKSMLHDMKEKGNSRKAMFFYGVNTVKDLYHADTMKQFEKDLPNFKYVPSIAKGSADDTWEGETGLVTEVLDRHVKDGQGKEGYLCGSPGMIDASVKVLVAKGVPEKKIYYDKFA